MMLTAVAAVAVAVVIMGVEILVWLLLLLLRPWTRQEGPAVLAPVRPCFPAPPRPAMHPVDGPYP